MEELIMRGRSEEENHAMYKNCFFDRGGLLVGLDFLKDVQSLNISLKAAQYDKNVLLLHGAKDISVPLCISDRYMEIYETRGRLHLIEGSDHTFNCKEWEEEVLSYTLEFLECELKQA